MSVLESLSGNIADFLVSVLSGISLCIDSLVYQLLGYAYNLFNVIASARVLSQDTLATLANRVYIIIGVIALFLVAYALLTAIIDPDKASKGDTSFGKIIPNIAIAIVAIALVPTIFTYAYRIQKDILCDNLIAKWILDSNPISSDDSGAYLATTLFQSFYYPKVSSTDEKANNDSTGITSEEEYNTRLQNITDSEGQPLSTAFDSARKGEKTLGDALGNFNENIKNKEIGYFMIVSTLAGGFCVYVLINYCFDAAKRAIKLAYLQLIAPLPILTIIIPGQKKIFQNWLKKTISCFTEIFVRIFVIVIVAFIAENLPNLVFNMSSMFNDGYGCVTEIGLVTALLVKALLILGLFAFAKEAPKLVSEITGVDSKGFKLGISDRLKESGPIGGVIDRVGGVMTGAAGAGYFALRNKQNPFSAMKYGAAQTFKNKGNGNQFGAGARDYYKNILKRDNEPSLLTGKQKVYDQKLDAYRKKAQNSYTDDVANRLKGSKQYRDKMNELLNGTVEEQYQKIATAQANYNAAKANYDNNMNEISSFEKSMEYNDLKNKTIIGAQARASDLMSKRYGENFRNDRNHMKEYERLYQTLQRQDIQSLLQNKYNNGELEADSKAAKYIKAVNNYQGLKNNMESANSTLKEVSSELENADKTTLDYFRNLKTDDKELSTLKDQAQFVTNRANEKEAKDYANSLEGQKYAQAMKEFMKQAGVGSPVKTGEFGAGPNTGGSDKPNGQR